MNKKETETLLAELQTEKDITSFLSSNTAELIELNLSSFLHKLLQDNRFKKSDVIQASGLDKTYAYHIFAGTKQPSRPKILAIALSMNLSLKQTQQLLRHARLNLLYPRDRWDAIIIIAIQEHFTVIETNTLLCQLNESIFLY